MVINFNQTHFLTQSKCKSSSQIYFKVSYSKNLSQHNSTATLLSLAQRLPSLLYTKVTGSNTHVLRQRQNCYDVVPFFDLELHRKNTVKLLQTLCDLVESLHES